MGKKIPVFDEGEYIPQNCGSQSESAGLGALGAAGADYFVSLCGISHLG
jgi:hypothetical protein